MKKLGNIIIGESRNRLGSTFYTQFSDTAFSFISDTLINSTIYTKIHNVEIHIKYQIRNEALYKKWKSPLPF